MIVHNLQPLVSVCIPNYNYEKFIGETIDSVLAQTYGNFEIIICDNCSIDNSIEVIKSYTDPRIRLYRNKENINLYENINKAISLSEGELIGILHSDDMWHPEFLEKVVEGYNKHPEERVFVSGAYNYHCGTNQLLPLYPYEEGGVKPQLEVMIRLQDQNNIGNGCNVVFHAECIGRAGMFSSRYRYASDYDLWLRFAEHYNFVYIPELLAYYRIHDSNLSHRVNRNLDMMREGCEIYRVNMGRSDVILWIIWMKLRR